MDHHHLRLILRVIHSGSGDGDREDALTAGTAELCGTTRGDEGLTAVGTGHVGLSGHGLGLHLGLRLGLLLRRRGSVRSVIGRRLGGDGRGGGLVLVVWDGLRGVGGRRLIVCTEEGREGTQSEQTVGDVEES